MAADGAFLRRPLVVSIVGTRPEAIKMVPVVHSLAGRPSLAQQLILTGQHAKLEAGFCLAPDRIRSLDLNLREQTAGEISETLRDALVRELRLRRPDLVLVQGDTSSALAGALAARECGIPVGHVEAGLRSGDLQQPWPEEGNRIRIDRLAALLFAPTPLAAHHLAEEGVAGAVHVTGNTGIDALLDAQARCPPARRRSGRKLILATCHRRENWGELASIAAALKRLVAALSVDVLFLLHSNPALRSTCRKLLAGEPRIRLVPAVEHQEMVLLMDRSWLILTDSGGLQEEGPALGKPVLVLRETTERTEALDTDNIELVGTDPDRILASVSRLLEDRDRYRRMSRPSFPFGDGKAAPRIAHLVERFLLAPSAATVAPMLTFVEGLDQKRGLS